jgi:hypothetical protein
MLASYLHLSQLFWAEYKDGLLVAHLEDAVYPWSLWSEHTFEAERPFTDLLKGTLGGLWAGL